MENSNQQREIVYCHQCENEWYRDEHGIICPSCQGEFTEVIEANNDPRNSQQHIPADTAPSQPPSNQGDFYAPDPDEDDIDNLQWQPTGPGVQWEQTGPGRFRLRGTYRTDIPIGPGQQQRPQVDGQGGGIMNIVGSALQGLLGAAQAQQNLQYGGQQQQPQRPDTPRSPLQEGPRLGVDGLGSPQRPASAPGSPPPSQQQRPGNGTFVRHGHGPGYSYTIASSSNSNFGPNLFPRNANAPQPYQGQPDQLEQMISQIFGNIGAMPGGAGGMRMGPGAPPHPFHNPPDGFIGGPFIIAGPNGHMHAGGMGPFANLFQLFGPPGGVAGDAVYSQEALDRIITQLMEQHQTGNAPGPASEAAIKALPTKTISDKDLGENGRAECSICMDEVSIGGTVTSLPCGHWFHAECIRAWLSEHDTCPHCRQGIMPKDGDANTARPRQPHQEPMHDMRSPEYTRPAVPGQFPFPRQNSAGPSGMTGDGSQQNPFTVPDSPTLNRRNSTGERRRSSGGGGGVFSRMRDAFGRGGSNGGAGS